MTNKKIKPEKIKDIKYLLSSVIRREATFDTPKNCFFLGSGCSVASGVPTGKGVIEICRKLSFIENHHPDFALNNEKKKEHDLYMMEVDQFIETKKKDFEKYVKEKESDFEPKNKEQIKNIEWTKGVPADVNFHKDCLYGNWFEEYNEDPKERQKLIESIIQDKKVGGEYILFAHLIEQNLIHNVFTTNFDDLLNEALMKFFDKRARVYTHNEMAQYISIGSKKPNIIKLHGDYLFENKNSVAETTELSPNMKIKFTETLNNLDMIVSGYGGSDHSIMSLLEAIKKDRPFRLIWCGRDPNKLHWRVVNLINNTQNSFFVEVPDFKTLVFKLWGIKSIMPKNLAKAGAEKQKELDLFFNEFKSSIKDNKNISEEEKSKFEASLKACDYFNMACKAYNEKDDNKAIELYSKAIELNPKDVNAYYNRGGCFGRLKQYKKAIEDYNKAIALDSKYVNAYLNLSELYIITGKEEDAWKTILNALSISNVCLEDLIPARYLECISLKLRNKDTQESEKALEKLLEQEIGLTWSFDSIDEWLETAAINKETKTFIQGKTKLLKQFSKNK